MEREGGERPYVEVDLQVACATKLPVADLERHRHLVVFVQALKETLAAVGGQLDVVRRHGGEEPGGC